MMIPPPSPKKEEGKETLMRYLYVLSPSTKTLGLAAMAG
jgi:hypothetical protein